MFHISDGWRIEGWTWLHFGGLENYCHHGWKIGIGSVCAHWTWDPTSKSSNWAPSFAKTIELKSTRKWSRGMMMMMMMIYVDLWLIWKFCWGIKMYTHTHGVKLVQWWPSRNLRPTLSPAVCPLTLRELTTGAREGGMFFSDSCIPQNLIDSHGFSNSQNFVGWCTPLPDGSKFFLEHDKGTRTFWSFFRCL